MRTAIGSAVLVCLLTACETSTAPRTTVTYPAARKGDVVDDYHGTKVPDPYRWMEELDSKEVADWVAAENRVTESYLQHLPLREPFKTRLTALWDYPRTGLPDVEGERIFYARNSGL